MAAEMVLRSEDIWRLILPYQDGLTLLLLDIKKDIVNVRKTKHEINQWTAIYYLSNIPARFASLPFIQYSLNADRKLPHYTLCLSNLDNDIILPLIFTIVERQPELVRQWMQCKLSWRDTQSLELAAACGHANIVSILYNYGIQTTKRAMDFAAMNGDLDLLKWFHDHGQKCTTRAMDGAASYGHFDVVEFLHTHRSKRGSAIALSRAAYNGHANITVKLLHRLRIQCCTQQAINFACGNGHLKIAQWLYANRSEGMNTLALTYAVAKRNFDVVFWLGEVLSIRCSPEALATAIYREDDAMYLKQQSKVDILIF
ncbi:hypothetical protein THRCLA_02577 [Thraustotheca clavata]|uniref:Uncharacterized protein n=1 Tax=Thraustotheca clavata TaxID=74557 RepID=A0A1W0A4Y2_9STRA|nr:hypothetical protein THRCLA_02577 [Thraustotheca clavata]